MITQYSNGNSQKDVLAPHDCLHYTSGITEGCNSIVAKCFILEQVNFLFSFLKKYLKYLLKKNMVQEAYRIANDILKVYEFSLA